MSGTITLTEDILDLPAYFETLDYSISPDFPEQFFSCYHALPQVERDKRSSIEDFEDIISVLIVKEQDQYENFHDDFNAFVKRKRIVTDEEAKTLWQDRQKRKTQMQSMLKNINREKQELKAKEEKLADCRQTLAKTNPVSETKMKSVDKLMAKYQNKLAKMSKIGKKSVVKLPRKQYTDLNQISNVNAHLKQAAAAAFIDDDYKDILKLIEKLLDINHLWEEHLHKYSRSKQAFDQLTKNVNTIQSHLKKHENRLTQLQNIDEADTIKIKGKSRHNREVFRGGGSVIQYSNDPVLDKELSKLKNADMGKIEEYLWMHAQQFRTHLIRNTHASAKRVIDIPATCKKACATDGVPVRLEYVKPKKQRTKMIMFLDVSGSCKNASSTMLCFMKTVTKVFGGGVKSYCFVNSLYDVSDMLYDDVSVKSVLAQIPTKGVYSNYYKPMMQFVQDHISEVNKDTILLFIGDARNNANRAPEELFKYAARKAKSTYWISTEGRDKWDYKDSIISTFAKYTNRTEAVMTTNELIQFLMHVR